MVCVGGLAAIGALVGASAASADTITYTPDIDTWITANSPDAANSTDTLLHVSGAPKEALIKFNTLPAGETVTSATLKVFVPTGDSNNDAVDLYHVAPGDWSEATTWNTAPALGTDLGTQTTSSGAWLSYDVTADVQHMVDVGAKPSYALARTGAGADDKFSSMEGTNPAELVVVTSGTDTTPPDTDITSSPDASTTATDASFTFDSTETGSSFKCALDGAAFSACTSPQAYSGLAVGSHTFQVEATDPAGNTDPTPASYTWDITGSGGGAPETTLTSAPQAVQADGQASFSFSTDTGTSFTCTLDSGSGSACTSPQVYSGLSAGDHTFTVAASNASGTDASPATYTFTVRPHTSLDSVSTTDTGADFTFSSGDANATFDCSVDGAAYAPCTSPLSLTGLALGDHSLSVRADDAGTLDNTPAEYTWTILATGGSGGSGDTTPPDTTITQNPPASTDNTDATFAFTSTEDGSTFQCSIDSKAFTDCQSPHTYSLAVGDHTFRVEATDAAGNTDPTPAEYDWTITAQTPPPSGNCLFTTPSYWCTALDASGTAPVDSSSSSYISDTEAHNPNPYLSLTDSTNWSQPIYESSCSDPSYHVVPTSNGPTIDVHIPTGAKTATGADGQISIIDDCNNIDVDMHHATFSGGSWSAEQTSSYSMSTPGLEETVWGGSPGNSGHRGLPTYARAVRLKDVQYAINNGLPDIGHRLEAGWYDTGAGQNAPIWPMAGWEQRHNGGVPEGMVLRIKPGVSPPSGMSAGELVIFRTLQNYGAVVGDTGGNNTVKLQNYVDWSSVGVSSNSLSNVPWSDYEFVKAGYDPATGGTH